MLLEQIKSPKDIKKMDVNQLNQLADEMRTAILNRTSKMGGHVGPNLGIVEATIALHQVFDAPKDKFVFDVSHQTYPHKMLTGRAFGYIDENRMAEVSGYSSPTESPEYDLFEVGHTSTSVALAAGLMKARDIKGERHNIIAVIGDGSLSGGEAYEGLNAAAEIGTNLIVVVNDNEMSIAENHGGIYQKLASLRDTNGCAEDNPFKAMGYEYCYVEEGNNVEILASTFNLYKHCKHPVIIHIHTEKGCGYEPAKKDKEPWHWCMPFEIETGKTKNTNKKEDWNTILGDWLRQEMQKDKTIVALSSASPQGIGFMAKEREEFGKQYMDAGIAEASAIAMASGMAKGGIKPVYTTWSTFLQRTFDQLAQDLAVNNNPAVINALGCSLFAMNDVTHIGFFDMPLISHIPNLVYLAPTTAEEMIAMEQWAINQTQYSVALRIPSGTVYHSTEKPDTDYSNLNTFKIEHAGNRVALIGVGNFMEKAKSVAKLLKEKGINATIINPRFVSGVDEDLLNSLCETHQLVVTIEDGTVDGGFGEKIARYYGTTHMKVMVKGLKKQIYDRYKIKDILNENRLMEDQIVEDILKILKS